MYIDVSRRDQIELSVISHKSFSLDCRDLISRCDDANLFHFFFTLAETVVSKGRTPFLKSKPSAHSEPLECFVKFRMPLPIVL